MLKILRKFFLVGAAFLCCLSLGIPSVSLALTLSPENLYAVINDARADAGLPALQPNAQLQSAAAERATDMADRHYFDHRSPDGTMPWDVAAAFGYDYTVIGENLAIDYTDAGAAIAAWLQSAPHRQNVLGKSYKEMGAAVSTRSGQYLTVVMFGASAGHVATVPTPPTSQSTIQKPEKVVVEPAEAPEAEVIVPVSIPENTPPDNKTSVISIVQITTASLQSILNELSYPTL